MVTGVGGGCLGEQMIKALRMSRRNYKIIGCDISPVSPGLRQVDLPYIVPRATDPHYMDAVLTICRKHAVKAIFIGSEPEIKAISPWRKKITDQGILLPLNPQSVIDICTDKKKTVDFLFQNGFPCPQTKIVASPEDLKDITTFPVVLKPASDSSGSANVMIAQNVEELTFFCKYLLKICPKILIQEYLGTPDSEYTVGVLCSMEGEIINSIVIKRYLLTALSNRLKIPNQTDNKQLGPILAISSGVSQGEVVSSPQIADVCEKIALKLGCTSTLNIQCRLSGGKVFVFEINPRFSGTTSLRALAGYNEPDILIRKYILKEKIKPRFNYKHGFIARGLQETFIDNVKIPKA